LEKGFYNLQKAKSNFENAIQINDKYSLGNYNLNYHVLAYVGLGNVALEMNKFDEAEDNHKIALSLSNIISEKIQSYMNLATVYFAQKV